MEEMNANNPGEPAIVPQDPSVNTTLSDSERKKAKLALQVHMTLSLLRSIGNGLLKILRDVRVAVLKR